MAGIVAIIVKIMPDSPDADLDEIKEKVEKNMVEEGAKNISFEIKPIAFGLNAIMLKMAWNEDKDTDIIGNNLSKIEHVSSVNIEDYRRAFG